MTEFLLCPLPLDALSICLFCLRVNPALANYLPMFDHKDKFIYSRRALNPSRKLVKCLQYTCVTIPSIPSQHCNPRPPNPQAEYIDSRSMTLSQLSAKGKPQRIGVFIPTQHPRSCPHRTQTCCNKTKVIITPPPLCHFDD